MGQGLLLRGGTSSILYNNGDGNTRGSQYTNDYGSIIQQGYLSLKVATVVPNIPPSGELTFFSKDRAGKIIPAVIGSSGVDFNIQGALFGNSIYRWVPSVTTGLSIAWSTTWLARNSSGAQSHPTKTSTNAMTSLNRANFSTGTTATGVSGIRSTNTVTWLGNGSGLGGFLFFARFGVETVSGTYRAFIGLSTNTSALANTPAEPSNALVNSIYLAKDTGDSTWQVVTRGSSTGGTNGVNFNKINTGITVTAGQVLDLYIHSAPNSQSIKFYIKDSVTGSDLYIGTSITTTSTLPGNTLFLYAQTQIASTTGTTPKLIALNRMYIECDL